jgi:hypothetical protein
LSEQVKTPLVGIKGVFQLDYTTKNSEYLKLYDIIIITDASKVEYPSIKIGGFVDGFGQ